MAVTGQSHRALRGTRARRESSYSHGNFTQGRPIRIASIFWGDRCTACVICISLPLRGSPGPIPLIRTQTLSYLSYASSWVRHEVFARRSPNYNQWQILQQGSEHIPGIISAWGFNARVMSPDTKMNVWLKSKSEQMRSRHLHKTRISSILI